MKYTLWPNMPTIRDNCIQAIRELDPKKPWTVEIKQYRKGKTHSQLGYFWGVVIPAIQKHIEETRGGHYSADRVYEWFLDEYAPKDLTTMGNKQKPTPKHISAMTVQEMSDFIESVLRHAATEMDLYIPEAE